MTDLVPSSSAAALGSGLDAVTLPSKLTVARGPGTFELSWRWREQVGKGAFFAPFFGVYYALNVATRQVPVVGLAFGAALALGMYLAWAKNVVRLRVAQGALVMRARPIGVRDLEVHAADVVAVRAIAQPSFYLGRRDTEKFRAHEEKRLAADKWAVVVVLAGGKKKALVGHMLPRAAAEAIAGLVSEALAGR